MNILVTGCAGFIGAKICELLLKEGNIVYGIDNYSDAYDSKLKYFRIDKLRKKSNFDFTECDISAKENLKFINDKIISKNKIDAVMNIAARAGVRQSIDDPWIYYSTNVVGCLNLLELCKLNGINKFVLASTSSVYGENNIPFSEELKTDYQLSPYASSKKAAESLCYVYHKNYELDISILRYFTVYGPAGRPDMSVYRFIKWIAEDHEVEVFGDGDQARDFTYIDDIARGSILALKNIGYEIINLGSGNPASINQIINIIEHELGKKGNIVNKGKHPADIISTCADISKAKELLGWTPQVDLKSGLINSINWYRENIDLVSSVKV